MRVYQGGVLPLTHLQGLISPDPFSWSPPPLRQDDIVESIRAGVERQLLAASASRTFTQMQLPFAPLIPGAGAVLLKV